MSDNIEQSYLSTWLNEMKTNQKPYLDPVLGETCVDVIKMACDKLKQKEHVFFMTIDLMEEYIWKKEHNEEIIEDPLLDACVIIFILGKYCGGGGANLTVSKIQRILFEICEDNYNKSAFSILDDLDNIILMFTINGRPTNILRELCVEFTYLLYSTRKQWDQYLKTLHSNRIDTFKNALASRFFIPITVLTCAFQSTLYELTETDEKVMGEILKLSGIHSCFYATFSAIMIHILKK